MAKNSQYLVNKIPTGYNVIKCDDDFNLVETYLVLDQDGHQFCSCPNTMAPECRHMRMIRLFKEHDAIDKGIFYCYDTDVWTEARAAFE